MEEYKSLKRLQEKNKIKKEDKNKVYTVFLTKTLLSGIFLLIGLCLIKGSMTIKNWTYKNIYQDNISFAVINDTYKKYFGEILPIENKVSNTNPVFNEQLTYNKKEKYKDGIKLDVKNSYLVPILESGIVVFIGDKDNYGKTIIVQQVNGIDLWYVGVDPNNIKIYDYLEQGDLLGEALSNEIYLYYQKDGEFIDNFENI